MIKLTFKAKTVSELQQAMREFLNSDSNVVDECNKEIDLAKALDEDAPATDAKPAKRKRRTKAEIAETKVETHNDEIADFNDDGGNLEDEFMPPPAPVAPPVPKAAPVAPVVPVAPPAQESNNSYTKEGFRMKMTALLKQKGATAVLSLMSLYGYAGMDDIPADQWQQIINDCASLPDVQAVVPPPVA